MYGEVRTEIYCHACQRDFVARLDMDLNGNHEITCPCGHIHYRVVENGKVTGERYRSSAGVIYYNSSTTYTITMSASTSSDIYLSNSWFNTTGTSS